MRVAALVPAYPPRSRVGAWAATHQFLAYLAASGHHVDVFTRADPGQKVVHVDGVHVGPDKDPLSVSTAVAIADVVLSHVGDTEVAAALADRWGKPNVRMAHGHINDPNVLEGAALVVFNSDNLAASVDCPAPWVVCRPPVVADKYRTTTGGRVTLVNLSEAKGAPLFWDLVGILPHRQFLGVKGAYGVQCVQELPNTIVIPNTPNMRDDVYAHTRVLLMPSERETWGMTAVEALASGIPVIAHPTDGLIESLGPAGIFVDRADTAAWVAEVERLHDRIEWAAASEAALARSAELDPAEDLERFANAITSICTEVAA